MGDQTLRRVLDESTGAWVYRPVDEASGRVVSKADFESQRADERRRARESDPKLKAEREKRWLAQQRGEIRDARLEASRSMRRDERVRKLETGLLERRRPRRGGVDEIAALPPPDVLVQLREEHRVAVANGMDRKNPGQFAFVKTALDAEETKHRAALAAAREKAYAKARARTGVKGAADFEAEPYDDDDEEEEETATRLATADAANARGVVLRGTLAGQRRVADQPPAVARLVTCRRHPNHPLVLASSL